MKHKLIVSSLSFKIRCSKPTETNSDALYHDCPQIFFKTAKNTSAGQSCFSNVADLNLEICNKEIHESFSWKYSETFQKTEKIWEERFWTSASEKSQRRYWKVESNLKQYHIRSPLKPFKQYGCDENMPKKIIPTFFPWVLNIHYFWTLSPTMVGGGVCVFALSKNKQR